MSTRRRPEGKNSEKGLMVKALGPAAEVFGKEIAPLAKETGQVATLVGTRLLGMLRGLVHGYDAVGEWLREAITNRLDEIPLERIAEPNPRIAVPATQALTYSLNDELIREMFANLMAADMNADTKETTHPAFVGMITEMTPLDARILRVLQRSPQVEFISRLSGRGRSRDLWTTLSFSVESASPQRTLEGLVNLIRLGLVEKRRDTYPIRPQFEELKDQMAAALRTRYGERITGAEQVESLGLGESVRPRVAGNGYYLTPFGINFVNICLGNIPT